MSCFRVFLGWGLRRFVFFRDTPGLRRFFYCTIQRTPSRRIVEAYIFFLLCMTFAKGSFFNITGHAATVYPHCFLDCLRHPIISYRQNASRSNLLGPSSSACFLGFSLVLYVSSDWYRRKQVLIFIRFMVNSFRTTSLYLDCWFYWRVWNAGRRPLQHLIHSTTPAPTSLRL